MSDVVIPEPRKNPSPLSPSPFVFYLSGPVSWQVFLYRKMQKLNAFACPLSLWTNLCKNDVWHTQSLDIQFGLSVCLFFWQPVSGFANEDDHPRKFCF